MSGVQTIAVSEGEEGLRLDRWFKAHFPALTHGRLEKLLRTGQIRVDGGRVKANTRLSEGQIVRVPPLDAITATAKKPAPPKMREEDMRAAQAMLIHKDDQVLVVNKPHGLAVQGGTGTARHLDGMLDALRFEAKERPRLVHRLDRDTSGVLVLGRSRLAANALAKAFKARSTRKVYWALVQGVPAHRAGDISLPLVKKGVLGGTDGERMVPAKRDDPDGKAALTRFAVVSQAGSQASWLALLPVTGRTHQLRVHCTFMDTPIVNDMKYGYGTKRPPLEGLPKGMHLHAFRIGIDHPDGGRLDVCAPLPAHMSETWDLLGFEVTDYEDPFVQGGCG